jgi:FSR family fosmidomycin resistance protein-like MFS transporter
LNKTTPTFQWSQLLALSAVHFLADMFSNILPAILPVIREEFALSLSSGIFVLVALVMTANTVQVLTGHLRADKTRPLFLHIGLILAACICLLAVLRGPGNFPAMISLAIVSGIGIAIVHPEGLRGVHALDGIPPAVSTATFMASGFLGFASGGIISTVLVWRSGLAGLYPLVLCPAIGILAVIFLRVRLAVETKPDSTTGPLTTKNQLPFWPIIAMAIPAGISTTILVSLLPTRLNELGFGLTFGGFSATMFGLGGALGSFVFAAIAHRKGELLCSTLALFLVLPLLLAYLTFIDSRAAVWMLFGAGSCAVSAYILMITLARNAAGPTFGLRMGLMVGGTWAVANAIFLALTPVAEHFGTHTLLKFTPLGYLLSAVFGLYIILKARRPRMQN